MKLTVFTDLETDDGMLLKLLEKDHDLVVVVGESQKIGLKMAVAKALVPNAAKVFAGMPSDTLYPDIPGFDPIQDDAYDQERIKSAIEWADAVLCIKPPREFLSWKDIVFPRKTDWFLQLSRIVVRQDRQDRDGLGYFAYVPIRSRVGRDFHRDWRGQRLGRN